MNMYSNDHSYVKIKNKLSPKKTELGVKHSGVPRVGVTRGANVWCHPQASFLLPIPFSEITIWTHTHTHTHNHILK